MKTVRKSLFLFSLFILAVGLVLAGCGSNGTSGKGKSAASGNKKASKDSNLVNFYMDKPNMKDVLNKIGKNEESKFGAGFKTVPYPGGSTEYKTTVKQSLQSNDPPDMFSWWAGYRMQDLVKSGRLADLTDEWKNYYEKQGVNPGLAKAYTFNGKIYGAPMIVAYWNVYYNKKVFDKYGLKEPKTWDQFINVLKTLKQHGKAPMALADQGWTNFIWFEALLTHSNPDLYQKLMTGKASYTDPGVVKVMKLWKSMIEKGYFSKPRKWDDSMAQKFVKGDIPMILAGQWYGTQLKTAGMKSGKDYSAFLLPSVNSSVPQVAIFETTPILVAKNNKNKAQTLKALRNFYKPKMQQTWISSQGFAPMTSGVKSDDPVTKKITQQIKTDNVKVLQRYWEATPPDISEFATSQFGKFILKPNTYMDVLKTIQKHAEQYWASQK